MTFIFIVIAFIDYYHYIIPDSLSLVLVITGLALALVNPFLSGSGIFRVLHALGAGTLGSLCMLIAGYIGSKIMKKDALGGGDIKLMFALGIVLGYVGSFMMVFIASLLGSVVGLSLMAIKKLTRGQYIPFGPFLIIGAYIVLIYPQITSFLWK